MPYPQLLWLFIHERFLVSAESDAEEQNLIANLLFQVCKPLLKIYGLKSQFLYLIVTALFDRYPNLIISQLYYITLYWIVVSVRKVKFFSDNCILKEPRHWDKRHLHWPLCNQHHKGDRVKDKFYFLQIWDIRSPPAKCIKSITSGGVTSDSSINDLTVNHSGTHVFAANGNTVKIWDLNK
jgi:hypothetical protein